MHTLLALSPRPLTRKALIAGLLFLAIGLLFSPAPAQAQSGDGLILAESAYDVEETLIRLAETMEEAGLTVFGNVNHGRNAASVDQELLPTQVLLFGNPRLGTPLMLTSPTVAIDLPQKYLIWEDTSGRTFISYNSVDYLIERHGLTGPEEALTRVRGALANFASTVAPEAEGEGGGEPDPEPTQVAEEEPAPEPTEAPQEEDPVVLPVTGRGSDGLSGLWITLGLLALGALFLVVPGLRRNLRENKIISLLLIGLLISITAIMPANVEADGHNGLIINPSPLSVEETVDKLQEAITSRNLNIMQVINHADNAASVGLELPPTQLIIFGNPNVGTGLMQASRSIGIDLPQKMLVWEDGEGSVQVAYNDIAYLAERHGVTGRDQVITNVTGALAAIVSEATASE